MAKKNKSNGSNGAVALYDSKAIAESVTEIVEGTTRVSVPLDGQPRQLNDINKLGYCLLEHGLYEMTPWEVKFSGSMVSAASITDRQRNVLKRLASTYLGIDIDAETVTRSSKSNGMEAHL